MRTLLVTLDWVPKGYTVGARRGPAWRRYVEDRKRLRAALVDAARAQGWPLAKRGHAPVRIGVAVWLGPTKAGKLTASGHDWTNYHKGIEDALTRDTGKGAARWPGLIWDDSPRYVRGPCPVDAGPYGIGAECEYVGGNGISMVIDPGVYVAEDGRERCVIYVEEVDR